MDAAGASDLTPPDGIAWDLVVIGAGTAGLVAARTAAGFGADVLLIERDRFGGDCLWTGCVPSKALLAAGAAAADARAASRLGVDVTGVRADLPRVLAHVRDAIATIEPVDSPAALREAGVRTATGEVSFAGFRRAHVRPARGRSEQGMSEQGRGSSAAVVAVPFRRAVIATGSRPAIPSIPGLADAGYLTSDSVWDADLWRGAGAAGQTPSRLLVLGGGSIGCELGQGFARLGIDVTIVEAGPRLLPAEDPAAAAALERALRADGVDVRLAARLTGIEAAAGTPLPSVRSERSGAGTATLADGTRIEVAAVLVAAGRVADTAGLAPHRAGIAVRADGAVTVDGRLRTTNRAIWAAGDVTGHPAFTHVAAHHGALAAANAVLGLRRGVGGVIPRVTYTSPEVASFGPAQAPPGGRVRRVGHDELDRAVTDARPAGFTALVLDRAGRVVGATVVGPRAGECLAELVLAAGRRLRSRDLARTVHAYPTYADATWRAAVADLDAVLGRGPVRAGIAALVRLRRT